MRKAYSPPMAAWRSSRYRPSQMPPTASPTSGRHTSIFSRAFSFHRRRGQGIAKNIPQAMENPSSHSLKAPRSFPQAG